MSIVANFFMDSIESPAAVKASNSAFFINAFGTPLPHPTPAIISLGRSTRVLSTNAGWTDSILLETSTHASFGPSLFGSVLRQVKTPLNLSVISSRLVLLASITKTFSELSMAEFTAFIFFGSSITSEKPSARSSTEGRFQMSVAVVITGVALIAFATLSARRFAPPMWPERRLMTNLPRSSTATIAGSRCLPFKSGATHLMAIPTAEIKTRASKRQNALDASFLRSPFTSLDGSKISTDSSAQAIFPERASPLSVSANTAVFPSLPGPFKPACHLFELIDHRVEKAFAFFSGRLSRVSPYSARPVLELVLYDERPREIRVFLF